MAHPAYRKLGDLAEAAINDEGLSDKFKSGNKSIIQPVLDEWGFTAEDIDVLRRGCQALAPRRREELPKAVTFWWW